MQSLQTGIPTRYTDRMIGKLTTVLILCALCLAAAGQSLYRYRDANGNWQFSDRQPEQGAARGEIERESLAPTATSPRVTLERVIGEDAVEIFARNDYYCPVQIVLELRDVSNVAATTDSEVETVLPASQRTRVMRIEPATPGEELHYRIAYRYAPGDPEARHAPARPYRVPFALGNRFKVTQAYPQQLTHVDAASAHALDISLPVGTAIYAARGGTVFDIAYDSYSGGTSAADVPRANLVRILHDDGTMAVYAHLAWNSIRVRPGQRVSRGEYLADSGNTGFSSGPHLHFAVQVNDDLKMRSLPVTFTGPAGSAVRPSGGDELTAY